jgi:F-type H+-transporting ATPase subunit b
MSLLSVSTALNAHLASTAASEGGVNVDLDASLLVQVVIFVALLIVLKPLLFEPMLKLFEERERRIDGTRREASKEDARSAEALARYEAILAKAREAGAAERDALRAESLRKEAESMATVREGAAATIEQGRAALASESTRVRADLTKEASLLGRAMASRVLGREVTP